VLFYALARMRVRRGRTLLAAVGVAAAGAMLGAAVTVATSLGDGFGRTAARAGLPDVIASFAPVEQARVAAVVSQLANVRSASYRLEGSGAHVTAGAFSNDHATVIGVGAGRRGYAVVSGRDLRAPREAVVEAGLARAWHLRLGQTIGLSYAYGETLRVVGFAVAPDTVAFPLAHGPRIYLGYADTTRVMGTQPGLVDGAELWLSDPRLLDVTLAQARSAASGLEGLQFVTRPALRLFIGQAAGIVIAVLVGFSVIVLLVAGTMLSVSAAAEVERRLEALGLLRAVGVSARDLVLAAAAEGAAVALPAGGLGIAAGWLVVRGPTDRLLGSLNELGPGWSIAPLLLAATAALVALVAASSAWPAWRATRRPPVAILRGADVAVTAARLPLPRAVAALGVRLVLARPARSIATVCVVGFAVSVVLAILAIASVLQNLDRRPLSVGKRYQLVVDAPAAEASRIARLPGVAAAAARYEVGVADSFSLDEPYTLLAFSGDPARFEAPLLTQGRRVRDAGEADVGLGLAQALGLHPGGVLAAELPNGREVRFRVVGVVEAFQDQGRIAYVRPERLLSAEPSLPAEVAVRLRPGASAAPVRRAVEHRGETSSSAGGVAGESVQGWAARSSGFIGVLVALLRSLAVLDAAVCLYAVAQALLLTAQERRRALAIVRAQGAAGRHLLSIFAVAAVSLVLLAGGLAVLLERLALAPEIARLAASYVLLALGAGGAVVAYTLVGLVGGALVVAAGVARAVARRPVIEGLRAD
jgi:ABC-type lipoprotein release transport system permease subunit